MKSWQIAEEFFRNLIDGWTPPGSGSKFRQGDILKDSWYLEVKHTDKDVVTLKAAWFDVLLKHSALYDVALCLSTPNSKAVYVFDTTVHNSKLWKSASFKDTEYPDYILYKRSSWKRYDPKEFASMVRNQ